MDERVRVSRDENVAKVMLSRGSSIPLTWKRSSNSPPP